MVRYRKEPNNKLLLGMQETSNLAQFIGKDNGLIPKVYIYYCDKFKTDSDAIASFNLEDK